MVECETQTIIWVPKWLAFCIRQIMEYYGENIHRKPLQFINCKSFRQEECEKILRLCRWINEEDRVVLYCIYSHIVSQWSVFGFESPDPDEHWCGRGTVRIKLHFGRWNAFENNMVMRKWQPPSVAWVKVFWYALADATEWQWHLWLWNFDCSLDRSSHQPHNMNQSAVILTWWCVKSILIFACLFVHTTHSCSIFCLEMFTSVLFYLLTSRSTTSAFLNETTNHRSHHHHHHH